MTGREIAARVGNKSENPSCGGGVRLDNHNRDPVLYREEIVVTMIVHFFSKALYQLEDILLQVAHHAVQFPATNQLDVGWIHSAPGVKQPGTDVFARDTSAMNRIVTGDYSWTRTRNVRIIT